MHENMAKVAMQRGRNTRMVDNNIKGEADVSPKLNIFVLPYYIKQPRRKMHNNRGDLKWGDINQLSYSCGRSKLNSIVLMIDKLTRCHHTIRLRKDVNTEGIPTLAMTMA